MSKSKSCKRNIIVTVQCYDGRSSGKTTVAGIIYEALTRCGYDVTISPLVQKIFHKVELPEGLFKKEFDAEKQAIRKSEWLKHPEKSTPSANIRLSVHTYK